MRKGGHAAPFFTRSSAFFAEAGLRLHEETCAVQPGPLGRQMPTLPDGPAVRGDTTYFVDR